ncbi:(2,3-dihydroxybenzoyl)adenylate synthase [Promicromonospora soli]
MSHHTRMGTVPWPDDVAAHYRSCGYWADRTLGELLWEVADGRPTQDAVVDGDVRLTYAELTARADAAAGRLRELGLGPDDRLLVQMPNGWEFIVLTLACFRAGVIPVMALPAHRRHELTHLASLSEARAMAVPRVLRDFDHERLAHELAAELPDLEHVLALGDAGELDPRSVPLAGLLAPGEDRAAERAAADAMRPDPDSPACFLISGGTTGLPKLITRTHNDYVCNLRATSATAELTEHDVYLGTLPASHNFPLACPGVLGTLLVGGRVVMLPSPAPARAFATIDREGVTVAAAVPAVAQRWIEHQEETGGTRTATLRILQVGGSRLPDEYAARIEPVLGARLQQVFGMAEGLINTTRLDDPADVITGTQGRPVHEADEIRILDPQGNDVPDGEPGAIYTRGPYTPRGYYNAPEHNERAFLAGGWYGSGDVVVRRPDGNLVVHGRDKDMVNRGGEKISAEEIEGLMYRLGDVEIAAAVSMPDPVLGERLCVYAVVKAGHRAPTLEDVREVFSRAEVAAFKYPDRLEIVERLPMTKVGKIDKRILREDIAGRLQKLSTDKENAR